MQAQLGADQPDFGVLFDDMACPEDTPSRVVLLGLTAATPDR